MKLAFLFPATFVSVCLALCSCASVSVREVIPLAEPPASGPQSIFVQTFEFEDDMVRVGRQGEELEQFKRTMQQEMTSNLLERIRKYIAPAQAVSSEAEAPRGKSWLISGRFTRVNQGSRFLRGALGFGSGGTKMDVTATVSDLSGKAPKRFLMIQTSGGRTQCQGRSSECSRGRRALQERTDLIAGLSSDCRRTSREITSALAQYMKRHGLQVADDVPKPKPRGSLPWLPQKRRGLVLTTSPCCPQRRAAVQRRQVEETPRAAKLVAIWVPRAHVSRVRCFYHPGYSYPLPEEHPFPMDKFWRAEQIIRAECPGARTITWVEPASIPQLKRVHTGAVFDDRSGQAACTARQWFVLGCRPARSC